MSAVETGSGRKFAVPAFTVLVGKQFETMFAGDKLPVVHMQRRNSQFQRKVSIRIGKLIFSETTSFDYL